MVHTKHPQIIEVADEPQLEGTIAELLGELELRPPSRVQAEERPGSVGSLSVQSLEMQ